MKKCLLIFSAVLCGSLFAQESEFIPGPPEQQFAQQGRPPNPSFAPARTGEPTPVPPPNPPSPGGPGIPAAPQHGGGGAFSQRLAGIVQRGPEGNVVMAGPFEEPAKRTLLVGFVKLDEAERKNIQEDVQIMSRILDKAAERALESTKNRRMGIDVMMLPGARGENIFIEDFGPLFILNVPIPLSGAGKSDAEGNEKEDSDWEQTKRELYQNRPYGGFEPMKFDAKKVETLKAELLDALKNATHIRQLKGDQLITVVVTGGENTRAVFSKQMVKKHDGEPGKEEMRHEIFEHKVTAPQPTTLTIRVKKSDVDAFASGKMKAEEFTKKAMILTQ